MGHLHLHDDAVQLDGALEAVRRARPRRPPRRAPRPAPRTPPPLPARHASTPACARRRSAAAAAARWRPRRRSGGRAIGARIGVLLVEAGERLGEQRRVAHRAREHADMVERARQQQRAAARDEAVRGLEADDAAERGRADHRAVGLRADGAGHHAGRHGGGRAARRAAGRALGVVRIAGLAGMEIGVLGGHGLAHDDRAGGAQAGHGRRVAARRAARPQRRAELGGHVAGVEDVLDADRHAVQRPDRLALLAVIVGRLGLPQGVLAVEERPGLRRSPSTSSMRFRQSRDQLDRGDAAVANVGGRFGEAERTQAHLLGRHRRALSPLKAIWTSSPAATAPCRGTCT